MELLILLGLVLVGGKVAKSNSEARPFTYMTNMEDQKTNTSISNDSLPYLRNLPMIDSPMPADISEFGGYNSRR